MPSRLRKGAPLVLKPISTLAGRRLAAGGVLEYAMQADLKALEFDGIRRLLEKLCATPFGAEAARNLEPAPSLDVARRMQAAVAAARAGLDSGAGPFMPELPDIRPALRQVRPLGAALSGMALLNLARVIRVGNELRPFVVARPDLFPGGAEALGGCADFVPLIDAAILPSGRVREDASQVLRDLHGDLQRLREEAHRALRPFLQPASSQSATLHWAGNRACLLMPAAVADRVRGVRRGAGPGGKGMVVEPMEVVGTNNHLEVLGGRIEGESQAVLRALSDEARNRLSSLQALLDALTWIDLALAGAQLAIHLRASPPELVEGTVIELDAAFHPQLLFAYGDGHGPEPRPLSVAIGDGCPILVVTGPNTGGKSVALKTVGLLTVMAHCGLHLPARRARIGNFTRLFVDMGDPQSVAHRLSTFSGHVEVLKRLLAEADSRTLVLLDELGTGTDPEEGAALAMAVLDALAHRGVQGMVTTHLSPLKGFAEGHSRLCNASMRFDPERLEPTYELQMGIPGSSLGLVIARSRGLPEDVMVAARAYLHRLVHH